MQTTTDIDKNTEVPKQRVHLAYLDGMRGLAALYVTLGHVCQFIYTGITVEDIPKWVSLTTALLKFGNYAVCLFIVLSGYCLMLPVANSSRQILSGGTSNFVKRRARRILPPYYACLVGTILLVMLVPGLKDKTGTQWDIALPVLTPGSLVSHFAVVHNLFKDWYWSLNPPMWTVALEWQIYFAFAFILLPIWRRFGNKITLIVAFTIGIVPAFLGGAYISSWFLGLFALGMVAAVLNFSSLPRLRLYVEKLPWIMMAGILFVVVYVISLATSKPPQNVTKDMILDILVGLATAMFLIGYTDRLQRKLAPPIIGKLLTDARVVGLGHFSYSLYLIHYPLLAVSYFFLLRLGLTLSQNLIALLAIFVPAVVGVAYLFHRGFERPFMSKV